MKQSLSSLVPIELAEPGETFMPCLEAVTWLRQTFLDPDSPLYNVEHDHLNSAEIGFLWTSMPNARQMKPVVGTAETGTPPTALSNRWAKARWAQQLTEWFGSASLDFVITIYAPYFVGTSEVEQCALLEHELYHCAQRLDEYGCPKFTKAGRPVFGIRGHDVEEFVGIVRRYGIGAGAGDSIAFVDAAKRKPEVAGVDIAGMCGACR